MERLSAVVVGGGVVGLATACALAGQGAKVTLLERFTIGHAWASSHGLTRAIRHEYGAEAIYTDMVARSLVLWDDLARETERRLYAETGVLTLGQPDDGHTLAGYEVLRAYGLPVERLTETECAARFPQFQPKDYGAITYNPRGGMLFASACLVALTQRLLARGGVIREGTGVERVDPAGDGGKVHLSDGTSLMADRVVVAAGPWVHDLLPELHVPVRPTRQQVLYLSGLSPELFDIGRFPVFLVGMHYYGFPLQGEGWLKVGSHQFGETVDPHAGYAPREDEVDEVRAFLRRAIPLAADGNVVLVDRCMYDVTPDEDFILDRHPGGDGVIVATGFSGHGFKFGVLLGEMLAALALGASSPVPMDRFRLSRFARRD